MREITEIFWHASASPHAQHDNIRTIRKWHTLPPPKGRGWSDIGYNFVITKAHKGKIHIGRPIHRVPAGASGHNENAIHICITGLTSFSDDQIIAAIDLTLTLLSIFDLTVDAVKGHYEVNENKTCPNMDMDEIRRLLCQKANSTGRNFLVPSPG